MHTTLNLEEEIPHQLLFQSPFIGNRVNHGHVCQSVLMSVKFIVEEYMCICRLLVIVEIKEPNIYRVFLFALRSYIFRFDKY